MNNYEKLRAELQHNGLCPEDTDMAIETIKRIRHNAEPFALREIAFQGKNPVSGWQKGSLFVRPESQMTFLSVLQTFIMTDGGYCCEVNPRTVRQYTGLTDKNDSEIYEGDVVQVLDAFVGVVVFAAGAFGIKVNTRIDYDYLASKIPAITGCRNSPLFCGNDHYISLWELYWNFNQEDDCCSVVEVIGNIHDNPELLQEGLR